MAEPLEPRRFRLEVAREERQVVHAARQLAVDRRRAVHQLDELDLDAAGIADRERQRRLGAVPAVAHVGRLRVVDAKERAGVDDLDPARDRGVEVVDDVRDLLDDAVLDRHGSSGITTR